MSNFIIKGTAFGFNYTEWENDPKMFSSILVSVVQNWLMKTYDNQAKQKINTSESISREYGKIRNSIVGFQNDIHNLSVNYNLMQKVINDLTTDEGFKSLYLSLLFENYIVNIRSLYDFTSLFPRILLNEKKILTLSRLKNSDSLNTVLKYCKKNKTPDKNVLPQRVFELVLSVEPELEDIKKIRDSIIHKGKEPIVNFNDEIVTLRIPKGSHYNTENNLPNLLSLDTNDDYPLFDYLKMLTRKLISFMENLGNIIGDLLYDKNQDYRPELIGLVGICMDDFIEFIYND